MSRIGKRPIELPSGVTATVSGQSVEVKGPKGVRNFTATDDVTLAQEDNAITVTPRGSSKRAKQQWGMSRTQPSCCLGTRAAYPTSVIAQIDAIARRFCSVRKHRIGCGPAALQVKKSQLWRASSSWIGGPVLFRRVGPII